MNQQLNCDHCGGTHQNVPVENANTRDGELGAYCPHCGEWHGLGENTPTNIETHPAVPDDEPVTVVCKNCNGGFKIKVK